MRASHRGRSRLRGRFKKAVTALPRRSRRIERSLSSLLHVLCAILMVFIRTMKGPIGFIAVLGMIVAGIINPFAAILFISILLVLSLVWRRIDASRARLVLDVTGFKQVPSYMTEEPARSERRSARLRSRRRRRTFETFVRLPKRRAKYRATTFTNFSIAPISSQSDTSASLSGKES